YFNSEQEYVAKREDRIRESLNRLEEELGYKDLSRIECYDISNIQGQMSYGSMTVALNGISTNSHYRIFKIKEDGKPEDPQMLKEVLTRRLGHIHKDKDESLSSKPDMLLIDGGVSQLSYIKSIVPSDIYLLGISKGKRLKRKGAKKVDEFWKVENGMIERVEVKNKEILVNLRDEAHRFALLHHRKLRKFVQKKSVLDEIEGIGLKRKKELLKKFGNIEGIKKASKDELYEVVKNIKVVEKLLALK
ncbi:MAG TPA: excinuclease ABC subunit UvrC, partial [Candidatus Dojkabacteria bacterium]|nr:excinuclease ABC subunit UvrC [Candidatus Dojkabacteria bacterium]